MPLSSLAYRRDSRFSKAGRSFFLHSSLVRRIDQSSKEMSEWQGKFEFNQQASRHETTPGPAQFYAFTQPCALCIIFIRTEFTKLLSILLFTAYNNNN